MEAKAAASHRGSCKGKKTKFPFGKANWKMSNGICRQKETGTSLLACTESGLLKGCSDSAHTSLSPQARRTSFSADFYFHGMAFQIWVSKCFLPAPSLYPASQTLSFNPRHISKSGSALQRPTHMMNPWIVHLEVSLQPGTDKLRSQMGSKSLRGFLKEQSVQLLWERTVTINSRRSFLAAPGVQLFR